MPKSLEQYSSSDDQKNEALPLDYFIKKFGTKPNNITPHNEQIISDNVIGSDVDAYRAEQGESLMSVIDGMYAETAPKDVDAKLWGEAHHKAWHEISKFLDGLSGQISRRAYHESFARIQDFSNIDIVNIILNSSESDWSAHPAYYKALSEEIRVRSSPEPKK